MKKQLLTLGIMLAALAAARADFNPVALTPGSYTYAIVVPSNSPAALPYCLTASQGGGTNLGDSTWFQQGYWRAPNTNFGVPGPGITFTDQSNPSVTYTMPPNYLTNNCLLADTTVPNGGTLTLVTPATNCAGLSILGSSGGGNGIVNYTVTHADTSTETGSLNYNDWFNGSPYAWIALGRVGTPGGGEQNNGQNPRLYSAAITTSTSSPVVSISFTYVNGGHVGIYAISTSTDGTTFTPAAVTGYNEIVIVPQSFPLTATMDQGTNTVDNANLATWFESGYVTNDTAWGIPPSGSTFSSLSQPTHHYQMGNYHTNCAILIDANHLVANITPATPAPYNAFAFLTAGGNVGGGHRMTNFCILQHQNGVQETNIFYGYDWFENGQPGFIAFKANGRVNMHDRTVNNLGNGFPYMFETYFALADTISPVTNIVLRYGTSPSANATTYIMAVSATAGGIGPVIETQPQWVDAFVGANASFSVAVGAGTPPLTYQWQKAPTAGGPYTNVLNIGDVSGATTTNLNFSSVQAGDNGWYQVVITNATDVATSTPPVMLYVLTSTLGNVTLPIDSISDASFGNVIPSNTGEGASNVVDRTTDKYLCFGLDSTNVGAAPFQGPVGFVLTPSLGASIVNALRIFTANDNPQRDPSDIMLEGSDDGVNWTNILPDTALSLPDNRNAEGLPLNLTNMPLQEVDFANTNAYASYRVTINNVKTNSVALGMQLAEIQFLGTLVGPPTIASNLQASYVFLEGFPLQLNVPVGGSAPLTYGWYYNGNPLGNGGRVSGANSNILTIANAQLSDSGTYQLFITNSLGTNSTAVAAVSVVPTLGFNGFGQGWSLNGIANFSQGSNVLQLTSGNTGQDASAFYQNQVYIGGFMATWTYYEANSTGGADGACFVLQTNGATTLGGGGGELGVGGISPSAEVEINIYSGNGVGGAGVAFSTNGITANVLDGSRFITDGETISFALTYLNGIASLVMTDPVLGTNFSISVPVNLPAAVGSDWAYVGFTGSDGGISSSQEIGDFNFIPIIPLTVTETSATTAVLSWPAGVGNYALQSSPSLVSPNWTTVGGIPAIVGNSNTVTVSTSGAAKYYRLDLQYTPQ